MEKIKIWLFSHKITAILAVILILLGVLGLWGMQKLTSKPIFVEVDLPFDAEGPYALLFPRKDGHAIILNIKRTSSYDAISYDLAYTSTPDETIVAGNKQSFPSADAERKITDEGEGEQVGGTIDRGVSGTIATKDKKGEYEQEILFGTCSKNVCKYDKGVENGTLTLHIKKGNKAYRIITQWHLQQPDVALGALTSLDGHFSYQVDADREILSNVGYSIINDLTGVPKLPLGKEVLGKVYALSVPIAKALPTGKVTIELAQNPPADAKIFRYNESESGWEELDTKINGSKLTTASNGAGIFAVLTSKK